MSGTTAVIFSGNGVPSITDSPNSVSSDGTTIQIIVPPNFTTGTYGVSVANLGNGNTVSSANTTTFTVIPSTSTTCPAGFTCNVNTNTTVTDNTDRTAAIKNMYISLLYRDPTVTVGTVGADLQGLNYWVNSGMSLDMVRQSIAGSYEGQLKAQIARFYQTDLNRTPDAQGINYWYEMIHTSNWTSAQVEAGIKSGVEYNSMPHAAVSTDPNCPPGYTCNINTPVPPPVSAVTTSAAPAGALPTNGSTISVGTTVTSASTPDARSQAISGYYLQYLGRPADASGLNYWIYSSQTLDKVITGIKATPEYAARRAAIAALYQKLLNRTPVDSEIDFWANNGLTTDLISQSIMKTSEYAKIHPATTSVPPTSTSASSASSLTSSIYDAIQEYNLSR